MGNIPNYNGAVKSLLNFRGPTIIAHENV